MAKLAAMPSLAIISGYKGTIDFYLWRGIPVARSWPRSPGHRRAAAVEAQWPVFTAASQLWNKVSPELQAAYNTMASGSTMSGRDMATKLYINATFMYPHLP